MCTHIQTQMQEQILCAAFKLCFLKIWSEMYNQAAKSHVDFQAMIMKSPLLEYKVIVYMTEEIISSHPIMFSIDNLTRIGNARRVQ